MIIKFAMLPVRLRQRKKCADILLILHKIDFYTFFIFAF